MVCILPHTSTLMEHRSALLPSWHTSLRKNSQNWRPYFYEFAATDAFSISEMMNWCTEVFSVVCMKNTKNTDVDIVVWSTLSIVHWPSVQKSTRYIHTHHEQEPSVILYSCLTLLAKHAFVNNSRIKPNVSKNILAEREVNIAGYWWYG